MKKDIALQFVRSWAACDSPVNPTAELQKWIEHRNRSVAVSIKKVPFDENGFWYYDEEEGAIRNRKGSFFSIMGLRCTHPQSGVWEQPVILQREIGYLGIICREIDGLLHFLMQAKIEPGNINKIQLSPTIQATKSNFTQLHGGNRPAYLDYFLQADEESIVVDQIQSEQSSRFFKKRNRNIIIMVEDEVEVLSSHRWMTLGQIKAFMKIDNLVNMDTRTVLSCIPACMWRPEQKEMREIEKCFENKALFRSIFTPPEQNPLPHIYRHINNIKMFDDTKREIVPLKSLSGWGMENGEFVSHGHADFKVVFCDIAIEGREVLRWTQPLFEAMGIATFGLVSFKKDGKQMFVTAARHEVGTFDRVELGPTLQEEAGCVPEERDAMAKLVWEQIEQNPACIRYDVLLSEEGGRFYHEQNRNIIIELTEEQIGTLPKGYFAVDYYTVNQLIQINNTCNIQLRNLLSLLEVF